MTDKLLIGFIGQGYIGKNYADDFENRGLNIVRFALEEPYVNNKDLISKCNVVFVAVPTPTTPSGYDASVIRKVIPLASEGSIVVIKSTILPGLTRILQEEFPNHTILHSPEFLSEATAKEDAAHPFSNIVGIPKDTEKHREAAKTVHAILPKAPFSITVSSEEAEIIKYVHNANGYAQIIFFNLMYDLSQKFGANWEKIEKAIKADPFISDRYAQPVHKSGRGAGGHCFIKDFAALTKLFEERIGDPVGTQVLKSMEKKNIELLKNSGKDLNLLKGVYGDVNHLI